MNKSRFVIALLLLSMMLTACVSYNLELVSDEQKNRNIYTQYPNYVNMLVRVTDGNVTTKDSQGNRIPDFSNPDYYVVGLEPQAGAPNTRSAFTVLENDIQIKVEAGLRVVPLEELELHINILLDVSGSMGETGLLHAKNAVKRLIARPCTQAEIEAEDPEAFEYQYLDWDAETSSVVMRNEIWKSILKENQIVKIYTFSDTVRILNLRETDSKGERFPDKTRQLLYTIDESVKLGVDSTNLYGALLAGLDNLNSIRSLNDPRKGFVDGVIVAFTDGSHTSGNIEYKGSNLTPNQAILKIHEIRGELDDLHSLRVITIAVNTPELRKSIKSGDLAGGGLRDIQNAGYLQVDNYGKLKAKFIEAFELIDRYTRSLYWIYYRSPKSGFQEVDIKVLVARPRFKKNFIDDVPPEATILEKISTNGFYQMLPGVYINDPILDSQGLPAQILDANSNNKALMGPDNIEVFTDEEKKVQNTRVYSLIRTNNPNEVIINTANTALIRLHSYVRANDNRFKPEYVITCSDNSIVKVIGYASLTAIESVALIECLKPGSAVIKVVDIANGNLENEVEIISKID